MKWLRRKKKSTCQISVEVAVSRHKQQQHNEQLFQGPRVSPYLLSQISPSILSRIFHFVCPHTLDESYESCELSTLADACMLCDLRDLARCACGAADRAVGGGGGEGPLIHGKLTPSFAFLPLSRYQSIRIDRVHYCELEAILAERRKRKSFMSRNADPEDTAQARLRLLCRTLRNDKEGIALNVQYLKIPYMTRETSKADLARTISVLPNLRYVDLPDGVFTDEASCDTLRLELQARCPDLRKMSYFRGAERSLEKLVDGNIWRNLEVMELSRLNLDPNILRYAMANLPRLRALKVTDMNSFNDRVFAHMNHDFLPPFPALVELILERTPNLTLDGLLPYLSRHDTQESLRTISLTTTGILPTHVQSILTLATKLEHFSINESISSALPVGVPLLKSQSLCTLHFEITATTDRFSESTISHYNYLRSSLMSGGLPKLQELYVLDPTFSETLLDLPLPRPSFAADLESYNPKKNHFSQSFNPYLSPTNTITSMSSRMSANNPYSIPTPSYVAQQRPSSSSAISNHISNSPLLPITPGFLLPQELEIYSKGLDEMEWNFSRIPSCKAVLNSPITTNSCQNNEETLPRPRRGSAALLPRPMSTYGLSNHADREWKGAGHDIRRSVIIGNGYGGFLAVPSLTEGENLRRPITSGTDYVSRSRLGL
ncbi:putative f-box domain-containing protein [Golovinomyces cichoracearum]|uniref:Putative f-box domain-containing protein n=1 Tax=Golovinomyces cichoracearum TaxID=62708 RepID=A0A420IK33_9PEZI|nr:putative f-box domain-containing protein [Golovinomyces cichoracearum]